MLSLSGVIVIQYDTNFISLNQTTHFGLIEVFTFKKTWKLFHQIELKMNDIDNYDFNPDSYCPEEFSEPGIAPERVFRQFKDNHLTFRERMMDAAKEWDLRRVLCNFYLFCISGYANDKLYPYMKFKSVFDKVAGLDFYDLEHEDRPIAILREAVLYFFDTDPDCNQYLDVLERFGWNAKNLLNEYHKTVIEASKVLNDIPGTLPFQKYYKPYLLSMFDEVSNSAYIPDLPKLAYWYCALSSVIKRGYLDNSWWENLERMSRADIYEYLCRMPVETSVFDNESQEMILYTVKLAIRYMEPFAKISKIQNNNLNINSIMETKNDILTQSDNTSDMSDAARTTTTSQDMQPEQEDMPQEMHIKTCEDLIEQLEVLAEEQRKCTDKMQHLIELAQCLKTRKTTSIHSNPTSCRYSLFSLMKKLSEEIQEEERQNQEEKREA